jgi:heme-degrading monooxygenase HmoA
MAFISVTRLRVRSFLYLPEFLWDTAQSVRQVQRSSGFLGGRLLVNAPYVFWTMTVWLDEVAMNAYRTGGAHRKAMPKLLNWCDEAAVVHWTQESPEIPAWQQAQQQMAEKGKLSKVNHPSPAQASQQIPAPRPSQIARILKPARQIQGRRG